MSLGAALYHCTGTVERTGIVLARALEAAERQDDQDTQPSRASGRCGASAITAARCAKPSPLQNALHE